MDLNKVWMHAHSISICDVGPPTFIFYTYLPKIQVIANESSWSFWSIEQDSGTYSILIRWLSGALVYISMNHCRCSIVNKFNSNLNVAYLLFLWKSCIEESKGECLRIAYFSSWVTCSFDISVSIFKTRIWPKELYNRGYYFLMYFGSN